jgi:hypothetical protein
VLIETLIALGAQVSVQWTSEYWTSEY